MSDIPDDIINLALEADKEFWAQDVSSGTENPVSFYVARAILAERERYRQLLSEAENREKEARAKALEDAAVVAERAIAEFTSDARAWASEKMPAAASQAKAQAKAAEMVAERIRALQSEER